MMITSKRRDERCGAFRCGGKDTSRGLYPGIQAWRDSSGHEVDILIENGDSLIPVEIKSSQTLSGDQFKGLHDWRELTGKNDAPAALIYGGDQAYQRSGVVVYPWFQV